MNQVIENIALCAGYALAAYTAVLGGAQLIGDLASQKIKSQEELDLIVVEEAEKLGLDKRLVLSKFYRKEDRDYSSIRGARSCIEIILILKGM